MTRYFHGGPAGIWPKRILPPDVTGAPSTASYGGEGVCRRDRVYVTTSLEAAMMFAAFAPGKAAVYEVVPEGDLEPDADCDAEGLSFSCKSARIVREAALPAKLRTGIRQLVDDTPLRSTDR